MRVGLVGGDPQMSSDFGKEGFTDSHRVTVVSMSDNYF
jgi:hypothetical protein